jgi:hypothetical protein
MIKKDKDGYHVYSKEGKHLGGPYSLEQAKRRLAEIEAFKRMKESAK